jgi:predicted outer membrane repeat protein
MLRRISVGLAASLFGLSSVSATAGTAIDVTRFDDPDPGGSGGGISLREAVLLANATPGADTITLHAGTYRLTIRGEELVPATTGDLDVTEAVTIEGDPAGKTIIDAHGAKDRAFEVFGGGALTLRHVTVKGGTTLFDGGGVFSVGALTVESSVFTSNKAADSGGGVSCEAGTCTLTDVLVTKNKVGNDGGAVNVDGSVTADLTRVTLSGNTAGDTGGGMNSDDGATVSLTDSLVSGNKSKFEGGGLDPSIGTLTVTNTTISGNRSTQGGGIQLETGGVLVLDNVTIAFNKAREGAGLWTELETTATLTNTLLAKNAPFDCFGPIVSNGSNLVGRVDGCAISGDATGNITGGPRPVKPVNPRIGTLRDNGGPTKTHALLIGSPAIDAVLGTCPPPGTDQRGVTRTGPCDIGAFELQ